MADPGQVILDVPSDNAIIFDNQNSRWCHTSISPLRVSSNVIVKVVSGSRLTDTSPTADTVLQGNAIEKLHYDEDLPALFAYVVNDTDVRMIYDRLPPPSGNAGWRPSPPPSAVAVAGVLVLGIVVRPSLLTSKY